jgi:hypothetical protein
MFEYKKYTANEILEYEILIITILSVIDLNKKTVNLFKK